MNVVYTHTFKMKLNGQDISGEVEFNLDGTMSYKTNEPIDAITMIKARRFHALLAEFKNVFDCFGGIEEIELTKK